MSRVWQSLVLLGAVLLCASFWMFPAKYPTLLGSGEEGASPRIDSQGRTLLAFNYPAYNARLPAFLNLALSRLLPAPQELPPMADLRQDPAVNHAWRLLAASAGTLAVLLLAGFCLKAGLPGSERFWIFLAAGASPLFLNAYGHYDSFMLPALLLLGWGILMIQLASQQILLGRELVLLLLVLLLALWAHPILVLLSFYSALYILQRNKQIPMRLRWSVLMGLAAGILPAIVRIARDPEWSAVFTSGRWPELLAGRALVIIPLLLPLVPLAAHVFSRIPTRYDIRAASHPAAAALASSLVLLGTVRGEPGPGIELQVTLHAGLLLWSLLVLHYTFPRFASWPLAATALLSLALFVPRAWISTSERLLPLQIAWLKVDPGLVHPRNESPHIQLALKLPLNSDLYQDARIEIFRRGAETEAKGWKEYRHRNLQYYIAWCYELGFEKEGIEALLECFQLYPEKVPSLWREGAFHTDTHKGRAWTALRRDSRHIIERNLGRSPHNKMLRDLRDLLDQREGLTP